MRGVHHLRPIHIEPVPPDHLPLHCLLLLLLLLLLPLTLPQCPGHVVEQDRSGHLISSREMGAREPVRLDNKG